MIGICSRFFPTPDQRNLHSTPTSQIGPFLAEFCRQKQDAVPPDGAVTGKSVIS